MERGKGDLAVWKEGWIVRAIGEGGAVDRCYVMPCLLLTKKAETALQSPFIRMYLPRGYETALNRLLLISIVCAIN